MHWEFLQEETERTEEGIVNHRILGIHRRELRVG